MLRIEARSDKALTELVPEMAQLRIRVFREWPYLYEGSLDYERGYMSRFIEAPNHIAICAFDGESLVGVATASPLVHQHDEFAAPFIKAGCKPDEIFYFGESVLLANYRGQGVGHSFFDGREAHAKVLGYEKTAFCGVVRPDDHPLKSPEIRPLDGFWRKRGYEKLDGLIAHFAWQDIGEDDESEKPMQYWGKGFRIK
ncbi:MAG: GNAT family N-acetyltransferase [Hyphomicrobiales bacterium]|nr:GNAT family N-acetyltransferase [Hyphomicrobiales bacterium]